MGTRRGFVGIVALASALLLSACTGAGTPAAPQTPAGNEGGGSGGYALAQTTLQVPATLRQAPFDETRQVTAPRGWQIELWARVPDARLAAWTPDDRLLVSRPAQGDVRVLTPGDDAAATPTDTALIDGLTQPHGLAFDGDTLYIAESNRVSAYTYRDGHISGGRTIVANLPNGSTPELRGSYAHALKSVAVDPEGALYISVGSTGNISAEDRAADPQRPVSCG